MSKKIVALLIVLITGLSGVFLFLAYAEDFRSYLYKKEKEARARVMDRNLERAKMMKF